jgi:hypothetical protein
VPGTRGIGIIAGTRDDEASGAGAGVLARESASDSEVRSDSDSNSDVHASELAEDDGDRALLGAN